MGIPAFRPEYQAMLNKNLWYIGFKVDPNLSSRNVCSMWNILAWNFQVIQKKSPEIWIKWLYVLPCDVACILFPCKCPRKHHFNTQCPIQSELRAIYHENKHEDHGCTSDDTVVIVSSCAQCALAKLHNAAFWQKIVQWKCSFLGWRHWFLTLN